MFVKVLAVQTNTDDVVEVGADWPHPAAKTVRRRIWIDRTPNRKCKLLYDSHPILTLRRISPLFEEAPMLTVIKGMFIRVDVQTDPKR